MKKYELTNETISYKFKTLYRIRALIDIPNYGVKAGDLGGFIEKEENLSHEGDCWVCTDAKVYDEAKVYGNALIFEKARVYRNAEVFDEAAVSGNVIVSDFAKVFGDSRIFQYAEVRGESKVYGSSVISGDAFISGCSNIYDKAHIYGHAKIYGKCKIYCNAKVCGNAILNIDADIKSIYDYITIGPIGSRNDFTTFFKTSSNNIGVSCGCFNGTLDEFIVRVSNVHENTIHGLRYQDAIQYAKSQLCDISKKKVFISLGMTGRTSLEIYNDIERAKRNINEIFNDVEFIDNMNSTAPNNNPGKTYHLGEAIKKLGKCDACYFVKGWENYKGCQVECKVCELYDIKIIDEVINKKSFG